MIPRHKAFLLPPKEYSDAELSVSPSGDRCIVSSVYIQDAFLIHLTSGDVQMLDLASHDEAKGNPSEVQWFSHEQLLCAWYDHNNNNKGTTIAIFDLTSRSYTTSTVQQKERMSLISTQEGGVLFVDDGQLIQLDSQLQQCSSHTLHGEFQTFAYRDGIVGILTKESITLAPLASMAEATVWPRKGHAPYPNQSRDYQHLPPQFTIAPGGENVLIGLPEESLQWWSKDGCIASAPIFRREGHTALKIASDASLALWDRQLFALPTLTRLPHQLPHKGQFAHQGQWLVANNNNHVCLWDLERLVQKPTPPGPKNETVAMCCSHDERWLAAGTSTGNVFLYDLQADPPQVCQHFSVRQGEIPCMVFDPTDQHLLLPTIEGEIGIWSRERGQLEDIWRDLQFAHPSRLSWAQEGQWLMVQGHESVVLIDIETRMIKHRLGPFLERKDKEWGHEYFRRVQDADIHPDGHTVAICFGYGDEDARLFDVTTGEESDTIPNARIIRFRRDGTELIVSDSNETYGMAWPKDGEQRTWHRTQCEEIVCTDNAAMLLHGEALTYVPFDQENNDTAAWASRFFDYIKAVAIAPNAQTLYTGGRALWLGQRSLQDGMLQEIIPAGAGHKITSLAFDPTGRYLIAGEQKGRIAIWNLTTHTRMALLDTSSAHSGTTPIDDLGNIKWLRFQERDNALLTIGNQWLLWKDWQDTLLQEPPQIAWEEPPHNILSLSHCGRWLLAGDKYGDDIELWDAHKQTLCHAFETGIESLEHFSVSHDGTLVIIGGTEGSNSILQAWSGDTGELLHTLHVDTDIYGCTIAPDNSGIAVVWMQTSTKRMETDDNSTPNEGKDRESSDEYDEYDEYNEPSGRDTRGLVVNWDVHKKNISKRFDASMMPSLCETREWCMARDAPQIISPSSVHSNDGIHAVIQATDARAQLYIEGQKSFATAHTIKNDGSTIAVANWIGEIKLWETHTGEGIATLCTTTEGGWWHETKAKDT